MRLAPDMRLQQTVRPEGGRWMADSAKLTFSEGFIQEYDVEPRTASLLILYDGTRTSEEVLARLSATKAGHTTVKRLMPWPGSSSSRWSV